MSSVLPDTVKIPVNGYRILAFAVNSLHWAFEERRWYQIVGDDSDPGQARNSGRVRVFGCFLEKQPMF